MDFLDSNKVLGKEIYNTFTAVAIGGDSGVINTLSEINCKGYNFLEFDVRAFGSGGKMWVQKTINGTDYFDTKIFFVYAASNTYNCKKLADGIFEQGRFILDVSDALGIRFVRKETVPTASVSMDVARLTTQRDILPKIVQIATATITRTTTTAAVAIERADISQFRFLVVRIKTIPQPGESSSVRETATISLNYRFTGTSYKDYENLVVDDVLTLDNYYVAASDWLMPKSDKVDVRVAAPEASVETPKTFEVTLMGIR